MLTLHHVGWHFVHPDDFEVLRPNGREDWLFLFFLSPAELELDGQWVPLDATSCIIFPPGMPQHFRARVAAFRNDWVHFYPDAEFPAFLERLNLPVGEPFLCPAPREISAIIRQISEENQLSSPVSRELMDLEIRRLFLKLSSSLSLQPPTPQTAVLQDIRNELYNAPYRRWTAAKMAARLNLSTSYFQHIYQAAFGCPVGADIIASRMNYAKYLLESTTFPISYLSTLCGYDTPEHFMRLFKKHEGMTPTQYRKLKNK